MEIYVQSCGVSQDHDYRWLKIPETGQPYSEIPRILKQASGIENGTNVRLTDLYESQEPTIVVARDRRELLLLVTALEATERTRVYGRQVRNSVAWVMQYSKENKQLLINIAAHVRQNWDYLRKAIDEAVEFDDLDGFKVNRKLINKYFKYVESLVNVGDIEDVDMQNDITQNSSIGSKISVLYWDSFQRNKAVYIFRLFVLFLMLTPLLLSVLITKILTSTNIQDIPMSPTPALSPKQHK